MTKDQIINIRNEAISMPVRYQQMIVDRETLIYLCTETLELRSRLEILEERWARNTVQRNRLRRELDAMKGVRNE